MKLPSFSQLAPVEIRSPELVVRFAKENPDWGYDRIQGALANLGHTISDSILKVGLNLNEVIDQFLSRRRSRCPLVGPVGDSQHSNIRLSAKDTNVVIHPELILPVEFACVTVVVVGEDAVEPFVRQEFSVFQLDRKHVLCLLRFSANNL